MTLERVFEMVWWRGRKWNHIKKKIWSSSVSLLSKYWLPLLFEETIGAFLFPSYSFLFMLHLLRTRGFWWYLRRKSHLQKLLFQWLQYTSGGRIFWNWVMHANMAKPWLRRWGSCGYIGGGRIVQSGVMHGNIFWVKLAKKILVANHFQKNFKTQMDTSLNKDQHNKSRYVDNI
jgi:hypothetical protein